MSSEKGEGRGVERFPTVDALLRNIQESIDISSRFLAQGDDIAAYETFAIESGIREDIDNAAKHVQAFRDLEDRMREAEEAAKALRIMQYEVNSPDELRGAIKGAMASYRALQEKLHEVEILVSPTAIG